MKINIQEWRPDTCGCVIRQEWDGDLPVEERTIDAHSIVSACLHHQIADKDVLHSIVLEENTRKNKTVSALLSALPSEAKKQDTNGGETFKTEPIWSFDENRKVVLSHPELAKVSDQVASTLRVDPSVDEAKVLFE